MDPINVSRASTEELKKLRVDEWSLWECEPSVFDWEYDLDETAYVLEGHVLVSTPEGVVEIKAGDLARFPKGLRCTWNVKERIRKVYRFGD
jgi:uncharacterized cupin superfamily protein